MYCDVKFENILIFDDGDVKFVDFGLVCVVVVVLIIFIGVILGIVVYLFFE